MYISYARPLLEYSSIVWDGCSEQDKTALERFQNEAARIVTGLTRSTSIANLYRECGWDALAKRRQFQKMCFCTNALIASFPITYLTPSRRLLERFQTTLYVIVKILQMYTPQNNLRTTQCKFP